MYEGGCRSAGAVQGAQRSGRVRVWEREGQDSVTTCGIRDTIKGGTIVLFQHSSHQLSLCVCGLPSSLVASSVAPYPDHTHQYNSLERQISLFRES